MNGGVALLAEGFGGFGGFGCGRDVEGLAGRGFETSGMTAEIVFICFGRELKAGSGLSRIVDWAGVVGPAETLLLLGEEPF